MKRNSCSVLVHLVIILSTSYCAPVSRVALSLLLRFATAVPVTRPRLASLLATALTTPPKQQQQPDIALFILDTIFLTGFVFPSSFLSSLLPVVSCESTTGLLAMDEPGAYSSTLHHSPLTYRAFELVATVLRTASRTVLHRRPVGRPSASLVKREDTAGPPVIIQLLQSAFCISQDAATALCQAVYGPAQQADNYLPSAVELLDVHGERLKLGEVALSLRSLTMMQLMCNAPIQARNLSSHHTSAASTCAMALYALSGLRTSRRHPGSSIPSTSPCPASWYLPGVGVSDARYETMHYHQQKRFLSQPVNCGTRRPSERAPQTADARIMTWRCSTFRLVPQSFTAGD